MKIGFKSDIHLDFWIKDLSEIDEFIKDVLNPQVSDVLILAGDIGHYNEQNVVLIEKLSKYSKIFLTYGNHDLYLLPDEKLKYSNSFKRLDDFKSMVSKIEGVYFFDGDLIEIDGVNFLGSAGWYDFSLGLKHGYSLNYMRENWEIIMNDSRMIFPKIDPVNFSFSHKEKLRANIQKADIVFTHVAPVYISCHNDLILDSFYSFYGYDLLEENVKYWIFGHCHKPMDFYEDIVRFISSPLGYPHIRTGKKGINYLNLKGL